MKCSIKTILFNEKGFTLIEMLAVIIMMGIIAAIVLPNVNTADENLKKNLFVSQFDSVFQKATHDARTVGEKVEIEFQEHHFQIYSSKPNREIEYPFGSIINSSDVGKRVIIDKKGMVQNPVTINFEYSKQDFVIEIEQGYKKAYINGQPLSELRKEGESP